MGTVEVQLVLVVVLILLNAAFAGSEIALISLREGQIERLEERGAGGRALVRLVRNPNQFLATIQIGITLAGFLASATAAVSLAQPLVEPLGFLGAAARPAAVVIVTLIISFVTLVFGELAPKRIAMQRSEGWALLAARPLSVLAAAARPAVWLLGVSTDLVVRLTGGDPSLQREDVSDEELRDLLSSRPGFHHVQREIVEGAFEISERNVHQIAVPRTDVLTVPADCPAEDAAALLVDAGHSRAPVSDGDLDRTAGVLHLRDLVGADGVAGDHMRPPLYLPESLRVLEALRQMRAERQHLALVVDEHGGITGILTLEDILEEVVGEIYDEFDEDIAQVRRNADGTIDLAGSFPLHDLPDLGVDIDSESSTTVAGVVLERLGRLPTGGERVTADGWELEVLSVRDRVISAVRLRPARRPAGE